MKKYPRFLAVILAVLFIGSLLLTVFGIHTQYGDVKTTVFFGANESNTGVGLSSEIMLTYYCPENTELNDELCNQIFEILHKRLVSFGINDAVISCDRSKGVFSVTISYNSRTQYDPNIIYQYLGSVGKIEIRAGNEKTEEGLPSGQTAEVVIVDNTDLRSVSFSQEGSGSNIKYNCELKYSGDSKKLIRDYTEKVTEASDATGKIYSIWLDNRMITSRSFSSVIKNGVIQAGTSVYTSSSLLSDYYAIQMLAAAEKLPFELSNTDVFNLSDPDNHSVFTTCLIIILIAVAVFGLLIMLRYKLAGVSVFLAMIGFIAVSGIVVSGGFDPNLGIYVSRNVFACFLSTFVMMMVLSVAILERVRGGLKEASAFRSVSDAYKSTERRGIIVLSVLVCITAVVYFVSKWFSVMIDLKEIMIAFAVFGLIGYLTVVLSGACISKSFASTKSLNSERFYGG